ncbi:MAG TPA: cytochrome c [Candidatus Methylomirabilis sp.]|nr:cytochrome c [Candidatus Methylomirabilis sp.]
MQVKTRSVLAIGTVLAILTPVLLHAAEPEDIIKYRKNMMKAIGAHMAAAGAIIQGKVDYKSQLSEHTNAVQALTWDIPGLFPKDSDFGDTQAKDEVWSNRAEFEKRAQTVKVRAEAFAKAVKTGNPQIIATDFKQLGEGCKSCHDDFRKKEDN